MQTAPFRTLCAMTLVAGISCLADGPGPRRRRSTTAPGRLRGRRPRPLSSAGLRHARRQDRKTEKPPPKRLPRLRCMGLRPPRRMDRILRKTRTRRHAPRPLPIPRHTTRIPHQARCVNPVARKRGRGRLAAAAPLSLPRLPRLSLPLVEAAPSLPSRLREGLGEGPSTRRAFAGLHGRRPPPGLPASGGGEDNRSGRSVALSPLADAASPSLPLVEAAPPLPSRLREGRPERRAFAGRQSGGFPVKGRWHRRRRLMRQPAIAYAAYAYGA